MGYRKKCNSKRWHDENEERRVRLLSNALLLLASEGQKFDGITRLAKRVAHMVSLEEAIGLDLDEVKKISHTTFLRYRAPNEEEPTEDRAPTEYRALLESYMAGEIQRRLDGGGTNELTEQEIKALIKKTPILKNHITKKDLRISNLKRELDEKKAELSRLKKHELSAPQVVSGEGQVDQAALEALRDDLSNTLTALHRLLAVCEWLEIDDENEQITDPTNLDKPIADTHILAPFFRARKKLGLARGGGK